METRNEKAQVRKHDPVDGGMTPRTVHWEGTHRKIRDFRLIRVSVLVFLLLTTALFVTSCAPPTPEESAAICGVLLLVVFFVLAVVTGIIWLITILISKLIAKHDGRSIQIDEAIQTPAAFIWNSLNGGKPGLKYGTLIVSGTQIALKIEKRSIRFPLRGVEHVSIQDANEAMSLIPEEFRGKNFNNRSIIEVKPRQRRVQPDYLIVVSTKAANTIAAGLEPTGLLRGPRWRRG